MGTRKRFSSLDEIDALARGHRFIRSSWFSRWLDRAVRESRVPFFEWIRWLTSFIFKKDAENWTAWRRLKYMVRNGDEYRSEQNNKTMALVKSKYKSLFDSLEAHPLTVEQRAAVVSDEDANLVLAGAGTGKTSTILAKIGLLLESGLCKEHEILAISFTKKSAQELEQRVVEKLGKNLSVLTFHALGLRILSEELGEKPTLAPFAADPNYRKRHIKEILDHLCGDPAIRHRFIEFVAFYALPEKHEWEFKSLSEYTQWVRSYSLMSLDGLPKKSYEEVRIANWLILQGIPFKYEENYAVKTSTPERRQYQPDFFLPEHNIYIEHFGVDETDTPAPHIDPEEYRRGMQWKRNTHSRYGTRLVETFSWQNKRGILFEVLEKKLRSLGVVPKPQDEGRVLEKLNKLGRLNSIPALFSTFLTLYKGNGCSINTDINSAQDRDVQREKVFLEIFEALLNRYEAINQDRGQIDFEDMITRAANAVTNGRYLSKHKYILVDEFQDISPGRAKLLSALKESRADCALFCVGDDWQSIYRFAGSDIGAMVKFEDYFGATMTSILRTTFRFDSEAVKVSSRFVSKNPVQIRKSLEAQRPGFRPSVSLYWRRADEAPLDWAFDEISKVAKDRQADVLVLGRYRHNRPKDPEVRRLHRMFPNVSFNYMTVHAAKGLEADFVVIDLVGGEWGFPAVKKDDPLLGLVLSAPDEFPYGEERRLFYVALTRARIHTYLMCGSAANVSPFAEELVADQCGDLSVHGINREAMRCRSCSSGIMVLRGGSSGRFYGCSNFPHCVSTQLACPSCRKGYMVTVLHGKHRCNECGHEASNCPICKEGLLVLKQGQNGKFWGCTNFHNPDINCNYTRSLYRNKRTLRRGRRRKRS